MTDTNSNIEQIEVSMEHAKATIAKLSSMRKLNDNKDFQDIVLDGYFVKEASRLVLLKADLAMQGEEEQKQIDNSINAIGYVRQYFNTIIQMGLMAERALVADQETHSELLNEAVGG